MPRIVMIVEMPIMDTCMNKDSINAQNRFPSSKLCTIMRISAGRMNVAELKMKKPRCIIRICVQTCPQLYIRSALSKTKQFV
jgi:hypothetical protein